MKSEKILNPGPRKKIKALRVPQANLNQRRAMTESDILSHASPSVRFTQMKVMIDGRKIDFAKYPYLIDLYDMPRSKKPLDIVVVKGAQLGFTSWQVLWVIDGAINLYQNQIGVYFPTEPDVTKFSQTRFARLMNQNPEIAKYIRDTNSAYIRQIGKVFVFFSGMKSRSAAKSTPNDLNVYDERDEMDDAMVELADRRLDGSEFKHRVEISTPTIPDYGVSYTYELSSKNHWMITCTACGKETCLELEFPQCLTRTDDTVLRVCVKCGNEIFPINGRWVPMHPDREKHGYYVSQLNSSTVFPEEILNEYEQKQRDGMDMAEFYNSRLGLPYAAIDDALEAPMILRLCKSIPRSIRSPGPCIMGADVGKQTHWMVGEKVTDTHLRVLNWGTVHTLDDLGPEVIDRFGVKAFVIDQMSESHKVRSFCQTYQGGYGAYYSSQMRDHLDWNHKERTVTCNRTETLDASHAIIVNQQVDFPRSDQDLRDEVIKQFTNLARTTRINPNTKRPEARWIARGTKRDHYRHAWNYLVMAADRVSAGAFRRMRLKQTATFTHKRTFMSA